MIRPLRDGTLALAVSPPYLDRCAVTLLSFARLIHSLPALEDVDRPDSQIVDSDLLLGHSPGREKFMERELFTGTHPRFSLSVARIPWSSTVFNRRTGYIHLPGASVLSRVYSELASAYSGKAVPHIRTCVVPGNLATTTKLRSLLESTSLISSDSAHRHLITASHSAERGKPCVLKSLSSRASCGGGSSPVMRYR